jgi:succinate dehydrogenase/fumarate reductase flavoprotein subunit
MAEGGAAAAMGNVNSNDNWQVHFRDTMRGGKFLNNYRMAELHAKESPDRIWELETYGALFDRTKDGKISQDDQHTRADELQKLTDDHIKTIDAALHNKEQEIMQV